MNQGSRSRWFFLSLVLVAGCKHDEAPRTPEPATAPPAATSPNQMTAQEKADILAMEAETLPNAPYLLDMTNPLHYRFTLAMLARGGETPAKSPEFFRRLAHAHEAKSADPAKAAPRRAKLAIDTSTSGPVDLNFISSFTVDGAPGKYQSTGLSSVRGGTRVTAIIMTLYNVQTGQIIGEDQDSTTEYAQGVDFQVQATGQTPPGILDTTSQSQGLFTYIPLTSSDAEADPVIVTYRTTDTVNPSSPCMAQPNYCVRSNGNCVPGQYQTACTNTVPNTTPIKICWYRGSQQECDYWNGTAHPTNFTFPMSGNVSFPNNTVYSPLTGFTYIALQNPVQGGGCNVYYQAASPLDPRYWSLSGTTVRWNYPAAAFPNTGDCINYYDGTDTILWMRGNVLLQGSPGQPPPYGSINFTGDRTQIGQPGVSIIPHMYIMQGCFAAGTQVLAGNGKPRRIEEYTGDGKESVLGGDGKAVAVSGTTRGTEPFRKMVRIKTDKGHELFVTEGHPIILADGTPALAKDLQVGQRVKTREGTAAISSVTREAYDGKVYNLRLGDPASPPEKGSTLYAGGILTGDSQMQGYYSRLEKEKLKRDPAEVEKRLPPEWLQDYKNHQK